MAEESVFSTIEEALSDLGAGKFLIVVDDEDRENEGDLVMAGQFVTPECVNFMETHARGLLCVPMAGTDLDRLELPLMVEDNTARHGCSFTVTVDAARGATTGISAADRALTISLLADPRSKPRDFARPGHVQPLRADPGGVLRRAGHTEAVVDLCILANLRPCGVLCEIKKDDGSMARLADLAEFARKHGDIKIVSLAQVIAYRRRSEKLFRRDCQGRLPTRFGDFNFHLYESTVDGLPYLALVMGDPRSKDAVLVRVHSSCLTGDVFHSLRCDCGEQLEQALERIAEEGCGVLLYVQQEGRGIGLFNKLRAYVLQEDGKDTVEANEALGFAPDLRDYGVGAQILVDLGLRRIRLMTNNRAKVAGLSGFGLELAEIVPLQVRPNKENLKYLKTKRDKLGHLLQIADPQE
jgi:3,4-dihydroxy 2-butanone 4-phosphate synthase/GTP cyclohydrolase II